MKSPPAKGTTLLFFCVFWFTTGLVYAQIPFGDRCVGHWRGMMYLYPQRQRDGHTYGLKNPRSKSMDLATIILQKKHQ